MTTTPQPGAPLCLVCLLPITAGEPVQTCAHPKCRTPYHQECWEYLGGCARYGCPKMVEVKKSAEQAATYWGSDKKRCPMCAEEILVGALECPFCKATFPDIRPVDREDVLPQPEDPILKACRKNAIRLLVFSALGVTSPFALLFGLLWYRSNKAEIERAGPTTKGLVLISLGICVVYLVLMAFGILIFLVAASPPPASV